MSSREYTKRPSKRMVLSIANKAIVYTNEVRPAGFAAFRRRADGSVILTLGPMGSFIPCSSEAKCLKQNELLTEVMVDVHVKDPAAPVYKLTYKGIPLAILVNDPVFISRLTEEEKVFYDFFMDKVLRGMFIEDAEGVPFYLFHDYLFDALYYTNSVPGSRDRLTWKEGDELESVVEYNRNAAPASSLLR